MAFNLQFKYIVLTLLFLTLWAVFVGFLGPTYLYSNLTLAAFGVWCIIDKKGEEPFLLYLAVYIFTMISDFMCLGVFGKDIPKSGDPHAKFALAMAIISLIAKFGFLYFLWREYNARGSAHVDGSTHAPLASGSYEPIPAPHPRVDRPYDPLHGADPQAQQQQQPQQYAPSSIPPTGSTQGGYQQL